MAPNRAERRSPLRWLRNLLFEDMWRKLASLGLAIGLWTYLDAQLSDSDDILLTPEFAPTEAVGATLAGNELTIGLDLESYGVVSMTSDLGTPLQSVTLTIHGPRRLVGFLQTATGFRAQPEIVEADGKWTATLTAADIVVEEPRLSGLRVELEPPEIQLELARNVTERIPMEPSRVSKTPPQGSTAGNFYERLIWSRMTFPEHPSAELTGPEQRVREIAQNAGEVFRISRNTPSPAPEATSMRVELEPILERPRQGWAGIRITDRHTAEIPLRIDETEFTLSEVPVILHEPAGLEGRFKPRRLTEELRIAATGRLQARLATLDEERRRAWVRENCLIVATVPPDTPAPDVISRPHVIVGPDFREGRDYKITLPLTIQYVDQPAPKTDGDDQTAKDDR